MLDGSFISRVLVTLFVLTVCIGGDQAMDSTDGVTVGEATVATVAVAVVIAVSCRRYPLHHCGDTMNKETLSPSEGLSFLRIH